MQIFDLEGNAMCTRMCPLTYDEAQEALEARAATGHARMARRNALCEPIRDAYPGSKVPAYVPDAAGDLATISLNWGFPLEGRKNAVFNTRIESALAQLRQGRRGMWADAIAHGRCLVPVRAFYESHGTETVASEKTGKPVRRQYRFRLPGVPAFLLAGIQQDGNLSIVTTEPNATVAPVHNRMPLVLGPGESSIWLGPAFASLIDRTNIDLSAQPEM